MKTITATALAMALSASSSAFAQDQEEGPVDIGGTGSAEVSASTTSEGSAQATGSGDGWHDAYKAPAENTESENESESRPSSSGGSAGVGSLRVYAGFRLGVGGGFTVWQDRDWLHRAAATPAIQAGADYVLWDYLALGAETRLNWVRVTDADERVMLWDLVLKPRVRYQTAGSKLELYGAMPFGLTIANYPDQADPTPATKDNENEITGKASGTLGFSAGINYFFNEHLGLNAEMGWLWHWVRADYAQLQDTAMGPQAIGDKTQRLGQFSVLNINVLYAL